MATAPLSPLERQLMSAVPGSPAANINELDVLRDVLIGIAGTPSQRNTLLRIIKQNQKSANRGRVIDKLSSFLGDLSPSAQSSFAKYSEQKPTDYVVIETAAVAEPSEEEDYTDDEYEEDENT